MKMEMRRKGRNRRIYRRNRLHNNAPMPLTSNIMEGHPIRIKCIYRIAGCPMASSLFPNSSGENEYLHFQNWDMEVESIIKDLWGNQEKTDALKTIWSGNEQDDRASKQEQQCKHQQMPLPPPAYAYSPFPFNSGNYAAWTPFNSYTSYAPMPANQFRNAYAPHFTVCRTPNPAPLPPVPTLTSGDVELLSKCFTVLESLDLDIKACEKLMGISSLNHPVRLPKSYDLEEVERLLSYSEKQMEFFTNLVSLVKDRFKCEEKRLEATNKKIEMWNQLREKDWDANSFQGEVFSSVKSISDRWIKVNNIFLMLLRENGKHHFSNLRLFPSYFKDLVAVVGDAKIAVWAASEKMKMSQGIPSCNFERVENVELLIPKAKIESSSSSNASTAGSEKTNYKRAHYRRRSGKNFKKF